MLESRKYSTLIWLEQLSYKQQVVDSSPTGSNMRRYVITYTNCNGVITTVDIEDDKSKVYDVACGLSANTRNTVRVADCKTGKIAWIQPGLFQEYLDFR